MAKTGEDVIGPVVWKIANAQLDGIASFDLLYREIPKYVALSADDLAPSPTRNGEPMWHQIVRNINCHKATPGNMINEGLLESVPGVGYQVKKQISSSH